MRCFKLGYLIDMAKKRSDMENSDLLDSTEWAMNASEVYGELMENVTLGNPRYRETEFEIIADGQADYELPDDFLTVLGVDYCSSPNDRRQLRMLQALERNTYSGVSQSEARGFAFLDSKIRLYPTPPAGQKYVMIYAPHPVRLECQGNNYNVDVVAPNGEKFMIYGMAELALIKEESFQAAQYCNAKVGEAKTAIQEWAGEQYIIEAQHPGVSNDYHNGAYDPAEHRNGGGR